MRSHHNLCVYRRESYSRERLSVCRARVIDGRRGKQRQIVHKLIDPGWREMLRWVTKYEICVGNTGVAQQCVRFGCSWCFMVDYEGDCNRKWVSALLWIGRGLKTKMYCSLNRRNWEVSTWGWFVWSIKSTWMIIKSKSAWLVLGFIVLDVFYVPDKLATEGWNC